MTTLQQQKRRKIVLISPAFQGGAALAFAVLGVAAAAVFASLVYRDVRMELWSASYAGHFRLQSAYDVAHEPLARHIAGLFAATLVTGVALFFLLVNRVQNATGRIAAVFRLSGEGDLSTPTDAGGPGEFPVVGKQADAARKSTLETIEGIRSEVELMRTESLSEDEFLRRWQGIKERIGRIAP